jgi:citrate lyase subunit beta/citryl-CoA lyase
MMTKAAGSSADEVILDLEDACAPSQKISARFTLVEALRTLDFGNKVRAFRPNALSTSLFFEDLTQVLRGAGALVDALVLPKVESADQVKRVDRLLTELETSLGLVPGRIELEVLVESARGLLAAEAIAQASPRLVSLIFGLADYAADVGSKDILGTSWDLYLYPRSHLLAVARAYGLLAIDSVTVQFRNLDQVKADSAAGARLGLDGKWAVHPSHLAPIHAAYTPSRQELDRALAVVRAAEKADLQAGTGAFVYGEEMIDEAGVRLERRKVDLARRIGLLEDPGQ